MIQKEKGSVHIILIIIIIVVILGGWFIYKQIEVGRIFLPGTKVSLTCDPLTLVSLKEFYNNSGIKPISAEKCSIDKDSYLLKLTYENNEQAEKAKFGLMLETSGVKKQTKEADLITNEGNSSAFYVEGSELNVLVMTATTDEAKVKGMVLGLKNIGNTQDETSKSTNILDVGGKATDSKIKSEMNQVKAALELYFAEKETYPKTLDELVSANIIKTIPTNPKINKPYDFFSNGESYTISTTLSDGNSYQVSSEE